MRHESLIFKVVGLLIPCLIILLIQTVGVTTYRVQPGVGAAENQDAVGVLPIKVSEFMASATQCPSPLLLVGEGRQTAEALTAFTNALAVIPGCDFARNVVLKGSTVKGVGPAVTLTAVNQATTELRWTGFIADDPIEFIIPAASIWLISFTNDLATDSEDRNLWISPVHEGGP